MPNNSFLKDYAGRYDDFYQDKDYKREALLLDGIFKKYSVKSVLDIACGTGNHMQELSRMGYAVKGADLSPYMVEIAKNKGLDASVCAMQDIDYTDRFDAVICMFASFDYIISDTNVSKMLHNVYKALKQGGVFIFDFWNKEYVEKDYKPIREKSGRLSFTSLKNDIAKIKIYFGGQSETHFMRYYNPEDVKKLLSDFTDIQMEPFDDNWSMRVICSKPR